MVGGSLRKLPASSITKTDRHDIAEILLKVALSTKNQSINQSISHCTTSKCIAYNKVWTKSHVETKSHML
jgi:hypothetical protein